MRFWRDVGEAMTEGFDRQRRLDDIRVHLWLLWDRAYLPYPVPWAKR